MLFSFFRQHSKRREPQRTRTTVSLSVEQLEDRSVPSTFDVLNLNNSGAGSLRQAILNANAHVGVDIIDFNVAGTITLTTGALPAITDKVVIDGSTAPGFAGTPKIEVNSNRFYGIVFSSTSAGSTLRSLGLVNAYGAGVTLNGGGSMLIVGNYIGMGLNGTTVAGNGGNGLDLNASSGNTIGGTTAQNRNIISGNKNNGIFISNSSSNQVVGNYIGTDMTGTLDRGNTGNGILVTGTA